jgi:hypothetical protein
MSVLDAGIGRFPRWHPCPVAQVSRVQLPPDVAGAFEVYVNGVLQRAGADYHVDGDTLVFERDLAREPRLGFWRWTSLLLGVAGTYKKNDSVDVVYERAGRRVVETGLSIVSLD